MVKGVVATQPRRLLGLRQMEAISGLVLLLRLIYNAQMQRRQTRQIQVGNVTIGGDAPISVQSMTAGYTHDIDECVAEIHRLTNAGADIVRVAVPEKKDTAALPEIISQVSVPIVADVHFHFKRALESIEAGVQKIRLNPGNIGDIEQVNAVIDACKDAPHSDPNWCK